jgi:hypothetical protein
VGWPFHHDPSNHLDGLQWLPPTALDSYWPLCEPEEAYPWNVGLAKVLPPHWWLRKMKQKGACPGLLVPGVMAGVTNGVTCAASDPTLSMSSGVEWANTSWMPMHQPYFHLSKSPPGYPHPVLQTDPFPQHTFTEGPLSR